MDKKMYAQQWHERSLREPHQQLYQTVLSLIPELEGARIADFGSSSCVFAAKAIERGAEHVTAIDAIVEAHDIARDYLADNAIGFSDTDPSADVLLRQGNITRKILNDGAYSHVTYILPSIRYGKEEAENYRDCFFEIMEQIGIDEDTIEHLLENHDQIQNKRMRYEIQKIHQEAVVRQTFRNAYQALEESGYFVLVQYAQFSIDDATLGEVIIKENLGMLGARDHEVFPYSIADVNFIKNLTVWSDIDGLEEGFSEKEVESDASYFKGAIMLVLQKQAKSLRH